MKDIARVDPVSSARPITFSDQFKTNRHNRHIEYEGKGFYKYAEDMGFKQESQEKEAKKDPEEELVGAKERGKGSKFDAYV